MTNTRTVRFTLLSIGLTGFLAALTVLAISLWSFQELDRRAKDALVANEVVADILPPPMYLVELRLVLSQAVEHSLPTVEAREQVERLVREYDARVARWQVEPPAGLDQLLLGEQHDAADHHAIERQAVEALVRQGKLEALAIEMAEEGQGTAHLNESASEAQVQAALSWNDKAWAWADYGPVVMAAVQAGVPVLGANLPRERMKDAMADVSLDVQLADPELAAQRQAVRDGHCGLLPEAQIVPMTRIQIARDRAMAQSVMKARSPGKTVLLIAGAGHTTKTLGVAQHLPTDVRVKSVQLTAGQDQPGAGHDATWRTPALPTKDYCAKLKADRG